MDLPGKAKFVRFHTPGNTLPVFLDGCVIVACHKPRVETLEMAGAFSAAARKNPMPDWRMCRKEGKCKKVKPVFVVKDHVQDLLVIHGRHSIPQRVKPAFQDVNFRKIDPADGFARFFSDTGKDPAVRRQNPGVAVEG